MKTIYWVFVLLFFKLACGSDEMVASIDADGDGFPFERDCDDTNPNIFPGSTEICGSGIDENCKAEDDDCEIDDVREGGVVFDVRAVRAF